MGEMGYTLMLAHTDRVLALSDTHILCVSLSRHTPSGHGRTVKSVTSIHLMLALRLAPEQTHSRVSPSQEHHRPSTMTRADTLACVTR